MSLLASTYTLTDPGAAITAGAACTPVSANQVTCSGATVTSLNIDVRDMADSASQQAPTASTITGGAGSDLLSGGGGIDTLNGGADHDMLNGGGGNDTLNGDTGNDALIGGVGNDVFNGLAGTDVADYSARTAPVAADIDGIADDGEPGETDNVRTDVEDLVGGSGGDALIGSTTANTLRGGPGNDSLDGSDLADVLEGGPGADSLVGGTGTDSADYSARTAPVTADIDGSADDGEAGEGDNVGTDVEVLTGGSGNDALTGGALADTLNGGPGADALAGGDGIDTVNGGDGNDRFDGGTGGDSFAGGEGVDLADYSARTAPVTADLDGSADDGELGETDNIRTDVEDLLGGAGDDDLSGNVRDNRLDGGPGPDDLGGSWERTC